MNYPKVKSLTLYNVKKNCICSRPEIYTWKTPETNIIRLIYSSDRCGEFLHFNAPLRFLSFVKLAICSSFFWKFTSQKGSFSRDMDTFLLKYLVKKNDFYILFSISSPKLMYSYLFTYLIGYLKFIQPWQTWH